MKPQKRFHSGKANLSFLRKNTQTKRGARPINRLNERESGNPAAPPPLLPTEGPFPPTAQRCARTAKTAIRAQQRTGTNKKAAPKRETAFSRPQQTFLKQCALPQSKKSSHRRNHVTLSRNALSEERPRKAPLPGPSPPLPQSYRRTLIPFSRERIRFSRRTLGSSAPGWREVTTAAR